MVLLVGLQCGIVTFLGHSHFIFCFENANIILGYINKLRKYVQLVANLFDMTMIVI